MAVPKKHTTKSHRDKKRMHVYLQAPSLVKCGKCGKPTKRHKVCLNCGYYKGKEVVNVLAKLEKKEKKKKQEELKQAEKKQQKEKSFDGVYPERSRRAQDRPMTMEELSKKKF